MYSSLPPTCLNLSFIDTEFRSPHLAHITMLKMTARVLELNMFFDLHGHFCTTNDVAKVSLYFLRKAITINHMSLVVRKPVFGVSDQV